ncbi:class I SAM-dependent RNA methyltransferase [Rhodobacteraceae bacterium XHP0102]|nr:class I SAM-dependent RNA methyltransferase [Rhodobacteraceae bacterium XHP0102]
MEIFLQGTPGLEDTLAEEARSLSFAGVHPVAGGVICQGDLSEAMRANLWLRGAGRVLIRIAEFRAMHLAQLDKRARKLDWGAILRNDRPWRVEATSRKSKIYHQRAAAERIEGAISAALGGTPTPEAQIVIKLRIEDDLCTLSLDTSGESLHKRGAKEFIGKAPMKETLAALFLRACGYHGQFPVVDPMCGSGTFLLEAAEIAARLPAGRGRSFAFEELAGFKNADWSAMRRNFSPRKAEAVQFYGFDRDQGAITGARANAERAGVADWISFACQPLSALEPPTKQNGLVILNPPYGARIGNRKLLFGLYGAIGAVMQERFHGWQFGMVTADEGLAKSTGLPWAEVSRPVAFGGLTVKLYQANL